MGELRRLAFCSNHEQPQAPGHQQQPADAGRPLAERQQLLDQYGDGEDGDPDEVHRPEDEEKRHQDPAAAEAGEAVLEAHAQGADGTMAPAVDDEVEGRAAGDEAGVLQRRQLVEAGGEEQHAAQPRTGHRHGHRRDQRRALEAPLRQCRGDAEAAPGQDIACREQGRRHPGLGAGAPARVDGGESQDHRRRARQHHADHHDPPHDQQQDEIDGALGRHGHGHIAHRPHVGRLGEQVEPAENGDASKCGSDREPGAQHQFQQRRRAAIRLPVRPPRRTARNVHCCPCRRG
jgi:hypothetical protein